MIVDQHRQRTASGFTLIEVMAALAILALFLVPLLGAVSQGLQFVGRARQRTQALQLAQDKLAEVLMTKTPEVEETKNGDFGRDYPGFRWEVESVKPPIFLLLEQRFAVKAMEMHVRVLYDEDGVKRVIQLDGIAIK
jgi:type II secretion system protein I